MEEEVGECVEGEAVIAAAAAVPVAVEAVMGLESAES